MTPLHFASALTPQGWRADVRVDARRRAIIAAVESGVAPSAGDERHALGLPALANLHSHAFQRAMAGLAERRGASTDTFWTWRETMYRFALAHDARGGRGDRRRSFMSRCWRRASPRSPSSIICTTRRTARPTPRRAELAERIVAAAAGDGDRPDAAAGFLRPRDLRRRAAASRAAPLHHRPRRLRATDRGLPRRARVGRVVGVAPHSLRAATPDELDGGRRAGAATAPIHIHVAEQIKEVEDCLAWSGARPVRWLLDHAAVDERWCLRPRHPHGRRRSARARGDAAPSPACARSPKPISATACSTRRAFSPPAAASASAGIPMSRSASPKNSTARIRAAARARARNRSRAARRLDGPRAVRRRARGRRAGAAARRAAGSPPARTPTSFRSTRPRRSSPGAKATRYSTHGSSRRETAPSIASGAAAQAGRGGRHRSARVDRRALAGRRCGGWLRHDGRGARLRPNARSPLHRRILADVEARIFSGEWPPGHRIPFEHELTARYGCSRMTVSKALTAARQRRPDRAPAQGGQFRHPAALAIGGAGDPRRRGRSGRARPAPTGSRSSRQKRRATRADRARLGVDAGARVLALTCRHDAAVRPFCLEDRLINLAAAPTPPTSPSPSSRPAHGCCAQRRGRAPNIASARRRRAAKRRGG